MTRSLILHLVIFAVGLVANGRAAAQKDAGKPGKVVLAPGDRVFFVGDSTTAGGSRPFGFVTLVQQAFDEQRPDDRLTATSRGYWAAPSGALKKAVEHVASLKVKPTHVVIYFGLNDSRAGNQEESLKQYAQHLRDAVAGFKEAGAGSILCTPTVWRTMKQTAPYAEVARQTARELDVPLLDLWKVFDQHIRAVSPTPFKDGEFAHLAGLPTPVDPTCDGVHHGAVGNRLIAHAFLEGVGMKGEWQKFPVMVSLGNINRNIGYGPRGKGTITMEPRKDFYRLGEKVTLTAAPDPGQEFHGWRGNLESKVRTVEFTVDGPAFIEAIVEAPHANEKK